MWGQTPHQAVLLLSINNNVGHFAIDSRGSVRYSCWRVALFPGRGIHPSHQQTVSISLNPVFNLHFFK